MELPCVVHIKLGITPATFSDLCRRDFSVVKQNSVAEQKVCNTVTSLLAAALNRSLLIATARANARLVLEIVTEESTKLQVMRARNEREIIFPNIEILAVVPGRLVPDVCVTACSPEERRDRAANVSICFRKHGRYCRCDFIFQRLAFRRRGDNDVVTGDRKLKFVNGPRRQRIRQLNGKGVARLTPVRRKRRIWRVAPEITGSAG